MVKPNLEYKNRLKGKGKNKINKKETSMQQKQSTVLYNSYE